jgi:small subunit ribosomal protein S11
MSETAAPVAPTTPETTEGTEVKKVVKKKLKRVVKNGIVHIMAGFNNTLITATDLEGRVLARTSAGGSGFKGTKKSTPYAAQVAAERLGEKLEQYGVQTISVYVKGIGPGREQGIRGLAKSFEVDLIVDVTGTPHNGCRARKRRRV